jgi:hypothetical protein
MISALRNTKYLGVRVHIPGSEAQQSNPIHLGILLDTSGSMGDDVPVSRLNIVKNTLHAAKGLFKPEDTVTLVTFNSTAKVETNYLSMNADGIVEFYTKLDALDAAGGTDLSAGLIELLRLQRPLMPYDAVMLLTDGMVNTGMVNTVGLRSMILSLHTPVTALGYGADHNRTLLRDVAVYSRGAYTMIDSSTNELLPCIVGDLLSGVRVQICKSAELTVPPGWCCLEPVCSDGLPSNKYNMGSLVPDRDYWVVFESDAIPASSTIVLTGVSQSPILLDRIIITDCHDLEEQVYRCKVARVLLNAADKMENGESVGFAPLQLAGELDLPEKESLRARPLVIQMRAQLEELLKMPPSSRNKKTLAHLSSAGACLSVQRGHLSGGRGESDPKALTFSSPLQRQASDYTQQIYSQTI